MMAGSTLLNHQRSPHHSVDELSKVCLCCLVKDVTFVNLSTCKHFGILKKLSSICVPILELGCLVCYRCHAKLKTICDFKLQAEECFNMLWSRQYSATKKYPKLEEVLLVSNVEYLPEKVQTYGTPIKPEQNTVTDYPDAISGCWLSDTQPVDKAEIINTVPLAKIKKEHSEDDVSGNRNHGPRVSKISTQAKNYHIEVSGFYPDSPQENEVLSDLDTDDVPLAKIKREVENEITEQTHEQVGVVERKQFADTKTNLAAVDIVKVPHFCTQCNKKFKSKNTLRNHNITKHQHPKMQRLTITTRQQKLDVYAGIIKEITLSHEGLLLEREMERMSETYLQRLHRCDLCIVGFNHKQLLTEHAKKHHFTGKSFKCGICRCVYKANYIMKAHEKKHYIRYECVVCQKRFNTLTSAIDHCNRLHELKNKVTYSCSQCNFTTMTNRKYSYHLQKHKGKSLCLICSSTFATKSLLRSHTFNVHGRSRESAPVQCKVCNKTYKSKRYLDAHNKLQHKPPSLSTVAANEDIPTPYYCDTCNIVFKNDLGLRNHFKRHKNHRSEIDKTFVCDICDRRFFTKGEIRIHITWKHLRIKEHTCLHCNKSYPMRSRLMKHIRYVHDKVRQPRDKICDYCGEGFRTGEILRSHIRRHTGERPYQCPHCPATFTQHGARHTHIKLVHTKSREPKC